MDWTTHAVQNQTPALENDNLYASDPALQRAVRRGGAGWRESELMRQGGLLGAAETRRLAEDANRFPPMLHTHSRTGERIDEVRFHPAWHAMMALAREAGIANLPFTDARPSSSSSCWTAMAAAQYLHGQVEAGSLCPTVMTQAAIPVLQKEPALFARLAPKLLSMRHDPRDAPIEDKESIAIGMGMTEKQGGSDVRTNATRAEPLSAPGRGEAYAIVGHKWFFSAPMCDAHLVLARTDDGLEGELSCFFLPRWQPDGTRNAVRIQRLKDKVGNRSNASAEVEFQDAWALMVGEPGRGIPTILEMAAISRLNCAIASAGLMRQALVQALHHARYRVAFGRPLIEQPLMARVLADLALESEAAMLLAMELAAGMGNADPLAAALRRIVTPAAKFWLCRRAVDVTAEAMEVLGGNGYVEENPMGRLFREAPVNAIWEGSGNVICLDVLRAIGRHPDDWTHLLDRMAETAAGEGRLLAAIGWLRDAAQRSGDAAQAEARRVAQKLALAVQSCLMLEHADSETAAAFIASRFHPDWGPAFGMSAGGADCRRLLRATWQPA
ncbi:MAG: acyl-CoA dehydrogenase family protein [Burkholderiaceae bacterium]